MSNPTRITSSLTFLLLLASIGVGINSCHGIHAGKNLEVRSGNHVASQVIYQSDPLSRLLAGGYHNGLTTLGELKALGDFGLGTFDDYRGGEMLILGGVIFSIPNPETSVPVSDTKLKTPFAMVTRFRPTQEVKLKQVEDYPALQKLLDSHFDPQKTYAISVEGVFHNLKVQAVRPPTEIGLPFEKISHAKAEFSDVSARFAGFRFGGEEAKTNHLTYHFHGRTQKGQGGHILDFQKAGPITVRWQEASEVVVLHP